MQSQAQNKRAPLVSMLQLLVIPERYEGQRIQVIGYLHLEFEGDAIYLHKEDFVHFINANSLWVGLTSSERQHAEATLNDRYVLIEGTFTGHSHGHLGDWPGTLTDVGTLAPWTFEMHEGSNAPPAPPPPSLPRSSHH